MPVMTAPYVRAAIAPTLRAAAIVIARVATAIPTTLRAAARAFTWRIAPVTMSGIAPEARTARAAAPTGGMCPHSRHEVASHSRHGGNGRRKGCLSRVVARLEASFGRRQSAA